jgi:hypothetical protein
MIWRRVLVLSSTTLRELHGILQVAMGWEGIHLFLFDVRVVRYGSFELHAASSDIFLQQFDLRENERFSYVYDIYGMATCMMGRRSSMIWSWILTKSKRNTPVSRPYEKQRANSKPTLPTMLG